MNLLFVVILGGWQIIALLAIVLLVLLALLLYVARKTVVTVPSMTLVLEKNTYDHSENVNVSGAVFSDVDKPAAGETVSLKLTDSSDTGFNVGSAQTGEDGKYVLSFNVPDDVAPGGVTVTAECEALGIEATATFTFAQHAQHPNVLGPIGPFITATLQYPMSPKVTTTPWASYLQT